MNILICLPLSHTPLQTFDHFLIYVYIGAVSVEILEETDGLGGLKDKDFAADLMRAVQTSYKGLTAWHVENGSHKYQ